MNDLPSDGPNWSDLRPRLLSALVLIAIVAVSLSMGSFAVATLVGLIVAGAYFEWEVMICAREPGWRGYAVMGLLALSLVGYAFGGGVIGLLLVGMAVLASMAAFDRWDRYVFRVFGTAYLGLAGLMFLAVRGNDLTGIYAALFLVITIGATDSAAYFFGRQIGGAKLWPEVSPGKTRSGALAGLAAGTVAGTILWIAVTDSPLLIGALMAFAVSLLGQIGDLFESRLKRWFMVKDSGNIIPGHGGILDRIDSLTVGAIVLYTIGVIHGGWDAIPAGILHW